MHRICFAVIGTKLVAIIKANSYKGQIRTTLVHIPALNLTVYGLHNNVG